MSRHVGNYAPRTIDTAVISHIDATVADTAKQSAAPPELRVIVLLGEAGNGTRTLLLRGVLPHIQGKTTTIRHAWNSTADVQACLSPDHVPPAPPTEGGVRCLIIACSGLESLPQWCSPGSDFPPHIFTVNTLSLTELDRYLSVELGAGVQFDSARRLGVDSGFVPAVLTRLVRTGRQVGILERINGVWRLVGDPTEEIVTPYVRTRLSALPTDTADVLFRMALSDPLPLQVESEHKEFEALRSEGLLRRIGDGKYVFRVASVARAIREASDPELQRTVYAAEIAANRASTHAIEWAVRTQHPVPQAVLDTTITELLDHRQWTEAVLLLELMLQFGVTDPHIKGRALQAPNPERQAEFLLLAASAALNIPDAERAHAHLDGAERVAEATPIDAEALRHRISLVRAEVLHFAEGDLEAALMELEAPAGASETVLAEKISFQVVHLALAGRTDEVRTITEANRRLLRSADENLQMRVKLCSTALTISGGRPQQALHDALALSSQTHVITRLSPAVQAELRSIIMMAALGSDGPQALPALTTQLESLREERYRPDLVAFNLARARWDYARGDISEAHRIAELALHTAEHNDPAGLQPALVALLAETSALLGDKTVVRAMLHRFSKLPLRASGLLIGSMRANLAAAKLLLGGSQTAAQLNELAREYVEKEQFGFAAEILHTGVRFGYQSSAKALLEFADRLDGQLNALRVEQASGVRDRDHLKLLEVGEQYDQAGLHLYAVECAAYVSTLENVPEAVLPRAAKLMNRLHSQPLPGHSLIAIPQEDAALQPLTRREQEIADLIDLGLRNSEIAARLHISQRTVEGHILRLYAKTGRSRRAPGRVA